MYSEIKNVANLNHHDLTVAVLAALTPPITRNIAFHFLNKYNEDRLTRQENMIINLAQNITALIMVITETQRKYIARI